jgi:DNA-binding CsgD family transcriptional regulator
MAGSAGVAGLLERDRELEQIGELLDCARVGEGSFMLVEGAAGCGKTRLLQAVCECAGEHSMRVLAGSGAEFERDFPCSVLRQLFGRLVADADADGDEELLGGAAALSRPVFTPARAGLEVAGDRAGAVAHGIYWLVANLGERAPLVLIVDDAHWADPASLQVLGYLARRLGDVPVLLAVAARPAEPGVPAGALEQLTETAAARVLRPGPLSEQAIAVLVRERLGSAAEEQFCRECHAVTAGNPLWVSALLAATAAEGFTGRSDEVTLLRELGPSSVSAAVLLRVSRMPEGATRLARALAVLGPAATIPAASELAGLAESEAVGLIARLTRAEILDDALPPTFTHPIVRAAIYQDLTAAERSHAHHRAAAILAAHGQPTDAVAAHLLLCDPHGNAEVIERLRVAAELALARAAPATAVRYLRRALAEPPTTENRGGVLAALGQAELVTRDAEAVNHLEAAHELSTDPVERARLAALLCDALLMSGRFTDAREIALNATEALGPTDLEPSAHLEFWLAWVNWFAPQDDASLDRLRELAARGGSHRHMAESWLALYMACEGHPRNVTINHIEHALTDEALPRPAMAAGVVRPILVTALVICDQLDRADLCLGQWHEAARRSGGALDYLGALAWQIGVALRRGDLLGTEELWRAVLALEPTSELILPTTTALHHFAEALIDSGRPREAIAAIADDLVAALAGGVNGATLIYARGRAAVALGRVEDGITDLRDCGKLLETVRFYNPNYFPWRSTLALALPPSDRDEARELIRTELARAERVGQPRAIGGALRARALLDHDDTTIDQLRVASATLAASPSRLEQARVMSDLGAALRRAGHRRDAREPLRSALDLAHRCGASVIADRAHTELLACGARPRRPMLTGPDALTPSERRIATMAATGASSKEIAQALFLSRRTVQMHLTAAYRKLGIDSRSGLEEALAP